EEKLRKAYCPPKIIDGNTVIEYYKMLAFPRPKALKITRDRKYGGDLEFTAFQDLEEAYHKGEIHPQDLKTNIARILSDLLGPARQYFDKHPEPLEEMKNLEAR
ncbi:MAG TPA: hypothetical protein VE177_07965, partial [Candidatus Binatus sp.]|nr:hypothetical protein [Candidatus Binatus sp.]